MQGIVAVATKPPKARRDDHFVDRLSSRYTVMLLIGYTIVIGFTAWVGTPMKCWVPKHFTGSHTKYANSFCWVNNTYYLPFHEYIPRAHEYDKRHMIRYYQWIPWILLSQAFFFWLPSLVWHGLNSKAGIDSDDILASANRLQDIKTGEKREGKLELLGNQLNRFLKAREEQMVPWKKGFACCLNFLFCKCCGRRTSSYLVAVYMLTKIFYIVNIICQFFALNGLLNTDFQSYGADYIELYHGNQTGLGPPGEFINSIVFPRVTMCDFNIRILGNNQRYTVQCVLPLNLYLEKMYLVFWFWLIFLIIVTGVDFILWFIRAVVRRDRLNFVRNHLNAGNFINSEKDYLMTEDFLDHYLKQDGCFLLRMIAHNTNTITSADITGKLFEKWKERKSQNGFNLDTLEEREPAELEEPAGPLPEKEDLLKENEMMDKPKPIHI